MKGAFDLKPGDVVRNNLFVRFVRAMEWTMRSGLDS